MLVRVAVVILHDHHEIGSVAKVPRYCRPVCHETVGGDL